MTLRLALPLVNLALPALTLSAFTLAAFTLAAVAQPAPTSTDLYLAMQLPEIIAIMRQEGLAYGDELAAQLFPGAPPPDWTRTIDEIYSVERMQAEVSTALSGALEGQDIAQMLAFFTAEPGATFVTLEASARRAMLDDAVEEAAKEAAAIAVADQTPRYDVVRRFVVANDLIETNVVSAMNSNVAYYLGLMQGGATDGDVTEDQLVADVWTQEPEIRASTTEWVYSFLLMAYDPLSDADLETYIAFSESDAGQALNRALFDAFDGAFEDISHMLGVASAQYMVTQEL